MEISQYRYDKDKIKQSISIDDVRDLVAELGGEPQPVRGNCFVSRTISHNERGEGSWKLYFYQNDTQGIFRDYTGGETFDIFELVRIVKTREDPRADGKEWELPQAVHFVANYFGFLPESANEEFEKSQIKEDIVYLNNYSRIKSIEPKKQIVELKTYDAPFLKYLPRPAIKEWIKDNITKDAMDYYDICFEPKNNSIIIPHYDIDNNLIGIRNRLLDPEAAERYGKYLPLKMNGKSYAHPLSFNLYGLYKNKDNIARSKKAIILESEKSVLQLDGILGRENNIAVACCGSSVIEYQFKLLMNLGVNEVIIALDRQFQELNDLEHEKLVKNLKKIHSKYGKFTNISFIFDKNKLTPYKASPSDCGADIFFQLYNERVNLY